MSPESPRASIERHSKSFGLASRLLPPRVAGDAAVVYAWCRRADDAIDEQDREPAARALARLQRELAELYAGQQPAADLSAFAGVMRAAGIPQKYPAELLADLRETADQLALQQREKTDEMKYKARPLDGIWATAPYLHNGSVPNLAELLKPEKERPAKFYVGTRYFDPKNVGFTTLKTDGAFEFDTSKPGNRNTGHNAYRPKGGGAPHVFTDAERMALVEYLKTL